MEEKESVNERWGAALSAGPQCLSVEALERILDRGAGAGPPDWAAHLADCPHCQAELAMLKSFEAAQPVRDEGAAVTWIAAQLDRRNAGKAAGAGPAPIPAWKRFLTSSYALASLAIVLVIAFGLSLYNSGTRRPGLSPGSPNDVLRSQTVHLIGPSGDLDVAPSRFSWEAFPGATEYSIQFFEVDGTTVWSGKTRQNFIATTPELQKLMPSGKPLLWQVTAMDANGRTLASSEKMRIRVVKGNKLR